MADPVAMDPLFLRVAAEGPPAAELSPAKKPVGKDFGTVLQDLVRETDELQKASDKTVQQLATGEADDLHQVMIAMAKADLSFKLMLEVRNKLLEAYQEVMRIQV